MSWSSAREQQHVAPGSAGDIAVEAGTRRVVGIEQRRALGHRFERVPVDGEAVVGVALRPRPHVLPLREQPHEQTDVVERLEHRDRAATGARAARRTRRGRPGPTRRGARSCEPRRASRGRTAPAAVAARAAARSTGAVSTVASAVERDRARRAARRRRRARGRRPREAGRARPAVARSRDQRSRVIHTTDARRRAERAHERVGVGRHRRARRPRPGPGAGAGRIDRRSPGAARPARRGARSRASRRRCGSPGWR